MSILLSVGEMLFTTFIVLGVAYILANIVLPIFNIRVNIHIKFYKADKAL